MSEHSDSSVPMPEGAPVTEHIPGLSPEAFARIGHIGLNNLYGETSAETFNTPRELWEAVHINNYYGLENRVGNNPVPTQEELAMGSYIEEVEPQARFAVLQMRQKGYNVGHAGFSADPQHTSQRLDLEKPLSADVVESLRKEGIELGTAYLYDTDNPHKGTWKGEWAGSIVFQPENPTDLLEITQKWDKLASILPDLGSPAAPATHGNAVRFREAAEADKLLDYYMPNGKFDPVGTKYSRARDINAGKELFLSDDPVSAMRELVFIDQYHELKDRLGVNPEPTDEEINMGAYTEEIEPQIRDAVIALRRKGYNTGSSGFWGHDHAGQAMDIATPIDDKTKAKLSEHMVEVTDRGIRFSPKNPSNIDEIKSAWDLVADILPDLGKHAEPAQNMGAEIFRYATKHKIYDFYLQDWLYQHGAFSSNDPLGMTLIHEGFSFGEDVHAPQRKAEARHHQVIRQLHQEHLARQRIHSTKK